MVNLAQVYAALDAQGASIYPHDIGFSPAATIELNGRCAVFFDPALVRSVPALKTCLAHECGHCATGAMHRTASRWDLVARHEYKADRWAIETFLPYEALCEAMRAGYRETWQLAEAFDVSQEFIEKAMRYYTEARALSFCV